MRRAPARNNGCCGPGTFETTRLNHGADDTARAAAARSAPGAYSPRPMIVSALIIIDDAFR